MNVFIVYVSSFINEVVNDGSASAHTTFRLICFTGFKWISTWDVGEYIKYFKVMLLLFVDMVNNYRLFTNTTEFLNKKQFFSAPNDCAKMFYYKRPKQNADWETGSIVINQLIFFSQIRSHSVSLFINSLEWGWYSILVVIPPNTSKKNFNLSVVTKKKFVSVYHRCIIRMLTNNTQNF